jgi:hypothetical protein
MSEHNCHVALAGALSALGYATAWENTPYQPTPGTSWVRETFAPDRKVAAALGTDAYNRITGVYLVGVFSPAGAGWKAAGDIAAAVLAAYKRGATLTAGGTTVRILRSYRAAGRSEPDWYHVPVTVEFLSDVAP